MADLNARIKPKKSSTASEVPLASDLEVSEIAVNTADGKLFTKHTDNSIKEIGGGAGPTDLTYTASTRLLESSTGTDVTLPEVVASGDSGLITGADKAKLDGIASGAEVNVQSDWNAVSGDALILNKPTLGTAAATDVGDYATSAQGTLADSAVQPTDSIDVLSDVDTTTIAPTDGQVLIWDNANSKWKPADAAIVGDEIIDGGNFESGTSAGDGTTIDGGVIT
jgi:hypothetical protein